MDLGVPQDVERDEGAGKVVNGERVVAFAGRW